MKAFHDIVRCCMLPGTVIWAAAHIRELCPGIPEELLFKARHLPDIHLRFCRALSASSPSSYASNSPLSLKPGKIEKLRLAPSLVQDLRLRGVYI